MHDLVTDGVLFVIAAVVLLALWRGLTGATVLRRRRNWEYRSTLEAGDDTCIGVLRRWRPKRKDRSGEGSNEKKRD